MRRSDLIEPSSARSDPTAERAVARADRSLRGRERAARFRRIACALADMAGVYVSIEYVEDKRTHERA